MQIFITQVAQHPEEARRFLGVCPQHARGPRVVQEPEGMPWCHFMVLETSGEAGAFLSVAMDFRKVYCNFWAAKILKWLLIWIRKDGFSLPPFWVKESKICTYKAGRFASDTLLIDSHILTVLLWNLETTCMWLSSLLQYPNTIYSIGSAIFRWIQGESNFSVRK